MIDATRLAAFALVALAIIIVPGPSVLFIISRGVALGRRAGVATAAGNNAGLAVQAAAVAFGLGALVERSVAVFTVLKLIGACYLVYLGIQAFRHRKALAASVEATAIPKSTRRIAREGFIVGVTNPKAAILFTAILPQFVDRSQGHASAQLLFFAVSIALICDSAWGLLAGTARSWLGLSPRRLEIMDGTGGVIMIGLGVSLALTGRKE